MFEADFGQGSVSLCEGGLEKPLTRSNIDEYIKLYLEKYTQQEDIQYRCVMQGIEDVCGKRLMMHMLPHLASRRACASNKIDMKSLKAVTRIECYGYNEELSESEMNKKKKEIKARFWRVIESFSHEDRGLFVKFATGRTRLAQGDNVTVELNANEMGEDEGGRLPTAGTCGNYVEIPNYKTEEVMTNCILIAIRLCGEIDNDGGGEYGSEDGEREEEDREAEVVNDNSEEGNFSLRNYALEGEEED